MEFTDEQFLAQNPAKFTAPRIRSILAERGVEVPTEKKTKDEYVQMFKNSQDTLRKGKKRKTRHAPQEEEEKEEDLCGTPTKAKRSKVAIKEEASTKKVERADGNTSTKKKRKSNIFQKRPSLGGNDVIEEQKPKKSRKSMPASSTHIEKEFTFTPPVATSKQATTSSGPAVAHIAPPSVGTLPFPILQETLHSATPYSSGSVNSSFNTPNTTNSDTSYTSTYNTPYSVQPASKQSASNAGRTPYAPPVGSRGYDEERKQREMERQMIMQQQHRGRRFDEDDMKSGLEDEPSKHKARRELNKDDEEVAEKEKISEEQLKKTEETLKKKEDENREEEERTQQHCDVLCDALTRPPGIPQYLYTTVVVLLWAIIVAVLALTLLSTATPSNRFCNTGDTSPQGDCIVCPQYGKCEEGKLDCSQGYVPSGLVCIEDEEINRLASNIADVANKLLMEAKGKYLCKETPRDYLRIDEVKAALSETGGYHLSNFDTAFSKAEVFLGDTTRFNITRAGDRLSAQEPIFGTWCEITVQARAHWLSLLALSAVAGLMMFVYILRKRCEVMNVRVQQLVRLAISELKQKKALHDAGKVGESFVVVTHLRDQLLRTNIERDSLKLWRAVEAMVRRESRVRDSPAMLHGAQEITWEWVGTNAAPATRQPVRTAHIQPTQSVDQRHFEGLG